MFYIFTCMNYIFLYELNNKGLEQAMLGMKKGAIRRIEVPSEQVFQARKDKQLPLPSASNDDGNRRFKNLFKTDAKLLFEVLLKSVEN